MMKTSRRFVASSWSAPGLPSSPVWPPRSWVSSRRALSPRAWGRGTPCQAAWPPSSRTPWRSYTQPGVIIIVKCFGDPSLWIMNEISYLQFSPCGTACPRHSWRCTDSTRPQWSWNCQVKTLLLEHFDIKLILWSFRKYCYNNNREMVKKYTFLYTKINIERNKITCAFGAHWQIKMCI